MSQAITYTEARQNLAETMNRVCDHHEPVIITRQKSPVLTLRGADVPGGLQRHHGDSLSAAFPGQCRPVAESIARR